MLLWEPAIIEWLYFDTTRVYAGAGITAHMLGWTKSTPSYASDAALSYAA